MLRVVSPASLNFVNTYVIFNDLKDGQCCRCVPELLLREKEELVSYYLDSSCSSIIHSTCA